MGEIIILGINLYIWLGIIMVGFGSILIHKGSQVSSDIQIDSLHVELNSLKKKSTELKDINTKQLNELDNQSELIRVLSSDNAVLSRELTKHSIEIKKSLLGGDSYPKIYYLPNYKDSMQTDIYLQVVGENPLYDVNFTHINESNADSISKKWIRNSQVDIKQYDEYMAAMDSAPVLKGGTFNSTGGMVLIGHGIFDPELGECHFRVRASARNGKFCQLTKLKKDDFGRWVMSNFKIVKEAKKGNDSEALLFEKTIE